VKFGTDRVDLVGFVIGVISDEAHNGVEPAALRAEVRLLDYSEGGPLKRLIEIAL